MGFSVEKAERPHKKGFLKSLFSSKSSKPARQEPMAKIPPSAEKPHWDAPDKTRPTGTSPASQRPSTAAPQAQHSASRHNQVQVSPNTEGSANVERSQPSARPMSLFPQDAASRHAGLVLSTSGEGGVSIQVLFEECTSETLPADSACSPTLKFTSQARALNGILRITNPSRPFISPRLTIVLFSGQGRTGQPVHDPEAPSAAGLHMRPIARSAAYVWKESVQVNTGTHEFPFSLPMSNKLPPTLHTFSKADAAKEVLHTLFVKMRRADRGHLIGKSDVVLQRCRRVETEEEAGERIITAEGAFANGFLNYHIEYAEVCNVDKPVTRVSFRAFKRHKYDSPILLGAVDCLWQEHVSIRGERGAAGTRLDRALHSPQRAHLPSDPHSAIVFSQPFSVPIQADAEFESLKITHAVSLTVDFSILPDCEQVHREVITIPVRFAGFIISSPQAGLGLSDYASTISASTGQDVAEIKVERLPSVATQSVRDPPRGPVGPGEVPPAAPTIEVTGAGAPATRQSSITAHAAGQQYRSEHDFQPAEADEMELAVGDLVEIWQSFEDGWATGENLTTRSKGFFPLNALGETAWKMSEAGAAGLSVPDAIGGTLTVCRRNKSLLPGKPENSRSQSPPPPLPMNTNTARKPVDSAVSGVNGINWAEAVDTTRESVAQPASRSKRMSIFTSQGSRSNPSSFISDSTATCRSPLSASSLVSKSHDDLQRAAVRPTSTASTSGSVRASAMPTSRYDAEGDQFMFPRPISPLPSNHRIGDIGSPAPLPPNSPQRRADRPMGSDNTPNPIDRYQRPFSMDGGFRDHEEMSIINAYNRRSSQGPPVGYDGRAVANQQQPVVQQVPVPGQAIPVTNYRALRSYQPRNAGDVEIMQGQVVAVEALIGPGWCYGTNRATGRRGYIPFTVLGPKMDEPMPSTARPLSPPPSQVQPQYLPRGSMDQSLKSRPSFDQSMNTSYYNQQPHIPQQQQQQPMNSRWSGAVPAPPQGTILPNNGYNYMPPHSYQPPASQYTSPQQPVHSSYHPQQIPAQLPTPPLPTPPLPQQLQQQSDGSRRPSSYFRGQTYSAYQVQLPQHPISPFHDVQRPQLSRHASHDALLLSPTPPPALQLPEYSKDPMPVLPNLPKSPETKQEPAQLSMDMKDPSKPSLQRLDDDLLKGLLTPQEYLKKRDGGWY
ncbi:uncharacterized protein EV422DRAFT_570744 [Fimicolochytrium jonesii]|uniref:uncharacterized protein n=1 Tax=Fimicolochytrium jonesii TaxID=1396493 RepID=UPI0022FE914C|nr:uncharacterized protein EV422DRAFT_570744 [Fimicolochytrium jonesii]KAI8817403.1 hypothetical protein EV422DRAFT_570744 [Fimicolochytrium jonesii]